MSRTSTGSSSPRSRSHATGGVPEEAAAVRRTVESLGVAPSKRLGQSFLVDPYVADAEAALLESSPGEPLLEIGPGLGILTNALLRRGLRPITVLEKDPRLAGFLRETFGAQVTVLEGDALVTPWPNARGVVGNLPFSVATPILARLWALGVPRFVGMVQREVAERLAAGPGSKAYGRLSILAALYGTVELFQVVPADKFYPPPVVDGQLLRFSRREGPLPVPSADRLGRLLEALFSSRRKQLKNLLGRVAPSGSVPERLAEAADWPVDWRSLRPENLPPVAYFRLASVLHRS